MKGINEKMFGNASKKISVMAKVCFAVILVISIIFIVVGINGIITWGSYGIADEDVVLGITRLVMGTLGVLFSYLGCVLCVGFSKIVENAEFEAKLDAEFYDYDVCEDVEEKEPKALEEGTREIEEELSSVLVEKTDDTKDTDKVEESKED